jgi:hypothetical protein
MWQELNYTLNLLQCQKNCLKTVIFRLFKKNFAFSKKAQEQRIIRMFVSVVMSLPCAAGAGKTCRGFFFKKGAAFSAFFKCLIAQGDCP